MEASRELEPWEVVIKYHETDNIKEMLQRVQFLTEIKCSVRALENLKHPMRSMVSYFDNFDERARYQLNQLPK